MKQSEMIFIGDSRSSQVVRMEQIVFFVQPLPCVMPSDIYVLHAVLPLHELSPKS